MNGKLILLSVLLALSATVGTSVAQSPNFDQYGLRTDRASASSESTKPKLFDFRRQESQPKSANPFANLFSRNQDSQAKPFQPFKGMEMPKLQMPKWEFPKFENNGEGMKNLFARPSWLPARDPNAPTWIERMNAKSKAFIDRTTNWAKGKSAQFQERKATTWDSVRQEMERIKQGAARGVETIQPPQRSANRSTAPRIKY